MTFLLDFLLLTSASLLTQFISLPHHFRFHHDSHLEIWPWKVTLLVGAAGCNVLSLKRGRHRWFLRSPLLSDLSGRTFRKNCAFEPNITSWNTAIAECELQWNFSSPLHCHSFSFWGELRGNRVQGLQGIFTILDKWTRWFRAHIGNKMLLRPTSAGCQWGYTCFWWNRACGARE